MILEQQVLTPTTHTTGWLAMRRMSDQGRRSPYAEYAEHVGPQVPGGGEAPKIKVAKKMSW